MILGNEWIEVNFARRNHRFIQAIPMQLTAKLNNFICSSNPSICTLALRMRKFIYCAITQISARVLRLKFFHRHEIEESPSSEHFPIFRYIASLDS
jgi:hypothetical protein